jgi:hypothetical protein
MTVTPAWLWRGTWSRLAAFPALSAAGFTGIALGGLCLLAALATGVEVLPEGNWLDTATFNGSVGFFVLTMVLLATEVGWTERGRRLWGGLLVVLLLYLFGIETVQAFRGLDPRFTVAGTSTDQLLGGVFFLAALCIMVCFLVLAAKYFRASSTTFTVAVRYGTAASLVAFGVGIVMSVVTRGRTVPEAGNLLVLHAAGFHGLQTIPLVALFSVWAGASDMVARRRVHVAGLAWLLTCLAVAWQSGSGRAIAEPSLASAVAAVALGTFAVVAVFSVRELLESDAPLQGVRS